MRSVKLSSAKAAASCARDVTGIVNRTDVMNKHRLRSRLNGTAIVSPHALKLKSGYRKALFSSWSGRQIAIEFNQYDRTAKPLGEFQYALRGAFLSIAVHRRTSSEFPNGLKKNFEW